MRILISPDKFKGSLSAGEVADSIAAGLGDVLPDAILDVVPVADGGEGTAEVISQSKGGEWNSCDAHDALGRAISGRYLRFRDDAMAIMEMSETAGGWRISPQDRDPISSNTYGVGQMLLAAAHRSHEVIVGLGGSITNDGGFGMARALGYRFLDSAGVPLNPRVSSLLDLERIESPADLILPRVTAASDVRNPLLGSRGATRTFGPQKGVQADQIETLERALTRFSEVVARDVGRDYREIPGAGAAGGLGFGLLSFCHADIKGGFEVVAEMINLEAAVARADFVVTGEGRLDAQTLEGKAPAGVARLARKLGKPVFAIVGSATEDLRTRTVFDQVFVLARPPVTREGSMRRAGLLLRERGRELGTSLRKIGPKY
jgi:glycerate kinase